MSTVMESYKNAVHEQNEGDVMGVIRTLFPDITVEMFMERKAKKNQRKRKTNVNK